MTEYTPTTAQVRSIFAGDGDWNHTGLPFERQAEFDRWLTARDAERDRQVAERAWDEGYDSGFDRGIWGDQPRVNPYRKDATGDWPPPKSREKIRKGAIDEIAEVLEKKEATGD